MDDKGEVIGIKDSKTLLEDIPNKIVMGLGIVVEINLLKKNKKEYLEIIVPKSNMPIAYRGVYHYRSGSTKQELKGPALQDFLLRKMGMTWDDMIDERISINDIEKKLLDFFKILQLTTKEWQKKQYQMI